MVAESPAFKKAVTDSRKLKAKPTDDDLLEVAYPLVYPSISSPTFSLTNGDLFGDDIIADCVLVWGMADLLPLQNRHRRGRSCCREAGVV